MKQNHYLRLIPLILLIAAAAWIVWPGHDVLELGTFQHNTKLVRGLDLQGGLRVLLEADLPADAEINLEQMQTARGIVENRVNGLGLTEALVQLAGDRRILVEIPGISDTERAVEVIRETGMLEFIEITVDEFMLIQSMPDQPIQTDFGLTGTESVSGNDAEASQIIFHTVLTGTDLEAAQATRDQYSNEPVVGIQFTEEGGQVFSEYTATHVGGMLGIVLDKKIISAPRISERIPGGSAIISGEFTSEEANDLALQLRYGSLPVPLRVAESKLVGPTLGEDSLQKSAMAGIASLSVVMLFMVLYYRLPGLLANLALACYTLFSIALFEIIPVTMTLPGIAGFVLSLGVAVDANVLIFERMKEELRNGHPLRQAINLGFERAWPSIRDSNISTLITCLILYWFGSSFGASMVKGFSITLAIGVMASLFTAITVTRTFMHVALDNFKLANHSRLFGI